MMILDGHGSIRPSTCGVPARARRLARALAVSPGGALRRDGGRAGAGASARPGAASAHPGAFQRRPSNFIVGLMQVM